MNKWLFLGSCFCLIQSAGYTIDQKPWFGDVYEFRADVGFSYSYFHRVNGAIHQPSHPSNNYLTFGGLGFTASEDVDVDLDVELARTPRQNYSFRSGAIQARYRFLNDIAADPISLVAGFNIRGVGAKSVKDISSPYASYVNFELTAAIGKEHSFESTWTLRGYGLIAIGAAIRGYPWGRFYGLFEANIQDTHRLGLFSDGYFGFGGKDHVNVNHFRGWGHVQHDSIDLGAFYGYKFGLWGLLSVGYSCRVFSHNYPEYEQRATLRYEIPFSLF